MALGDIAGSWGRSGYDPGSMGISSGARSSSAQSKSDGGLAGSWARTGYDPGSMGVLSGLSGPSNAEGYAGSYLSTMGARGITQEQGLNTYSDSKGNVYAFNSTSGRIDRIGAPSYAGGIMTTARGYQVGREKTGMLSGRGINETFPQTYRDALYGKEQAVRDRYTQEVLPDLQRQIDEQYQMTLEEAGLTEAIAERSKNLGLLSQGLAGELEGLGFDVEGMRDLPGTGILGRMGSQLGFDVDEYATPEATLSELVASGAVEYNEETGQYEETGKLGRMAAGSFLSLLTGFPGLARLAYGATESVPAALAAQKAASVGGKYLLGEASPIKNSLQGSIASGLLNYAAPGYAQALSVAKKGASGFGSMLDYASQLQAAGIRPVGDFYADPVRSGTGESKERPARNLAEIYYAQNNGEQEYPWMFYGSPDYSGNLATYYKMFAPYTV